MVRHTLKILQRLLQDFKSVSGQFGVVCMKGLKYFNTQRIEMSLSYGKYSIDLQCSWAKFGHA